MGVRSRSKRKRRRGASSADLISGLGDDVLVRILELLPDARDAVRTAALSRRWRGLWTRLSSLTFDSSRRSRRKSLKSASSDDTRFLAFVNKALAQRATTDAALEHLAVSFAITAPVDDDELVLRSADDAQDWVRYAVHSKVKSFALKLQLFPCRRREIRRGNVTERQQKPTMNLTELASSAKLETMHWKLKGVRLQLPVAAVFASLVDLSLENIEFAAGSGHLLARFLSSACCPSLQKLRLAKFRLPGLNELLIDASALLELSMSSGSAMEDSWTLRLKTPGLRFFRTEEDYPNLSVLGFSAPRLEELTLWPYQADHIDIDGELPCVKSLKVELESHGGYEEDDDINNVSIRLLRCCTSLTSLEVSLHVDMEEDGVGDIISGRIPHLPHLISLTVHVYLWELHSFGVGLAEILKQCSHLKYLRVHCKQRGYRDGNSLCNHLDHWKFHQMYLANIQEVDFTGLAGTDCERWFMQRVLEHATQLQKVALNFDPRCRLDNMIDGYGFIPFNVGTWVCHEPPLTYEWNYDLMRK